MKVGFYSAVFTLCGALTSVAPQALAVAVPCPGPPPPSILVATTPPAAPISPSLSFACSGLIFSNFSVVESGSINPVRVVLDSALVDASLGFVYLNFNPNLFAAANNTADIHFYFQVTGGISGIDLSVGGDRSSIFELACATAIDRTAANNCTGGLKNQLASLTNTSGNANVTAAFNTTDPVFIYKDIQADGRGTTVGAQLTSFTQSFHFSGGGSTPSAIPEPASMILLGAGLFGMASLRRRLGR